MGKNNLKHSVLKALFLFVLSQSIMLFSLNSIPIGGEWATVGREWIENIIGLN